MRRPAKIALWIAAGFVGVFALALLLLLVITNTPLGREQVRRYAERSLNEMANGRVEIGRASGNLLTGITLAGVEITDSTGAPFLRADTVSTRYSLRALLAEHIVLTDVRLVRPDVVLDKRPGEEWNFLRIFPTDTTEQEEKKRGLGSWILLEDVAIVGGHVQIRTPWAPADSLSDTARAAEIRRALAGEKRQRIVRVPGGFQSLTDLHRLNAALPRLRVADPDSTDVVADVARLSALAELFNDPGTADVRDLAGHFRIGHDSIHFVDARLALPATRIAGEGVYAVATGDLRARASGAPLALADLRWAYPKLPEEGGGRIDDLALAMRRGVRTTFTATGIDLRVGRAEIAGRLGMAGGGTHEVRGPEARLSRPGKRP